jgi:hypothetical protein
VILPERFAPFAGRSQHYENYFFLMARSTSESLGFLP